MRVSEAVIPQVKVLTKDDGASAWVIHIPDDSAMESAGSYMLQVGILIFTSFLSPSIQPRLKFEQIHVCSLLVVHVFGSYILSLLPHSSLLPCIHLI